MQALGNSQAGPSNSGVSRFLVQTSDVLQDMRVNVSEENSDKVIWYKERFLGDNEIIENVVHSPTNTICWTIHRPKRGWYIRIRSPAFPPGAFILLTPVPQTSPYHTDGSLGFGSRTNIFTPSTPADELPSFTLQSDDSTATVHSYPPTPPPAVVVVHPPTPAAFPEDEPQQPRKQLRKSRPPPTQITQFILSPYSTQPQVLQPSASFFSRALSVLKSHAPSHTSSFTLSRIPSSTPSFPPPPYAAQSLSNLAAGAVQSTTSLTPEAPPLPPPLLVFHDRTPVLTIRSVTGMIEIDKAEERLLGVDTSFWIAMALTYLEFLEERESYLAALGD
ncbi:hypothetical protein BDQ12DRAFT_143606 [Crucibulum laeve]|uniref:Uncharacterized protein n=1 Tax=Crucibulum laeve TaxID=68775 RepID=A0A5C3M8R7_9AGAR|nr:hypothetical protein BDQ12DRAFT_143606 [Crucibulum laeve]